MIETDLARTALKQTEIDGVRCFWVETGRPTLSSLLVFRSGMADEALPESGWLHLIEHLALHDREHGTLSVNGSVDLTLTTLQAHGPADLVARHLGELTGWFAEPGFEQLERERRVLRAEADVRGGNPAGRALGWRYGARGPGVPMFGEPGLSRAAPQRLTGLTRRVFTQGNAVLMLDGPPPTDLRLQLPDGPSQPWSTAVPCDDEVPARYIEEAGLILSGVVPRSAAATLAVEVLRTTLNERFRDLDGSAYAPWATYERVDAQHAVLLGGTDVRAEGRERLADTALAIVAELGTMPPSQERLDRIKAAQVQSILDPYNRFAIAVRAANEALLGRSAMSLDQLVEEVRAVTPGEILDVFEAFASQLLLGLPSGVPSHDQLPFLEDLTHPPRAQGRRWKSHNWPADRSRVVISEEVVEVQGSRLARSVDLRHVAGMLSYDNDVRHLIGDDGYGITIDTRQWNRPESLRNALDAAVPEAKRIPMAVSGDLAGDRGAPKRLGVISRWTTAAGPQKRSDTWAFVVLFVIFLSFSLLDLTIGDHDTIGLYAITTVLGLRIAWRQR